MDTIKTPLIAETVINAPIEKVWALWTDPFHIPKWNNASMEWHTTHAENDLRVGGKLFLRMELKDGTGGFDYTCIYDEVTVHEKIAHTTSDNRKTTVLFAVTANGIKLTEIFGPESKIPLAIQQAFCQSILDNFKEYVEDAGQ